MRHPSDVFDKTISSAPARLTGFDQLRLGSHFSAAQTVSTMKAPGELKKIQQSNAISGSNLGVESSPERIKNFLIHYNSFKNAAEIRNKSTNIGAVTLANAIN